MKICPVCSSPLSCGVCVVQHDMDNVLNWMKYNVEGLDNVKTYHGSKAKNTTDKATLSFMRRRR